jgi:lysophospholipase L1-like esterase
MNHSPARRASLPATYPFALVAMFLALALLALAGCSEKPGQLPQLAADDTILAFGDSLTHGTGANPGEGYPEILAMLTGRRVINAGVPGETTADALARLPRTLEETSPDLVVLCIGGNDFLRKLDPAQTRSNLERMIQMVRAANVPVVLVAVPKPALFSGSDPVYRELATEFKLPLENGIVNEVLRDGELKSDPIHPNAAGYRKIAQALAELLEKSGAI